MLEPTDEYVVEQATTSFLRKSAKITSIPLFLRAHLLRKTKKPTGVSTDNDTADSCTTCGLSFQQEGCRYKLKKRRQKRVVLTVACKGCGTSTAPVGLSQAVEPRSMTEPKTPEPPPTPPTLPKTPTQTSTARKKERANKLRKLVSLEVASESPTQSLSAFLSSLHAS
jgi:hypothetical protein